MIDLPRILCGPILRRCDEQLTTVWLATSYELPAKAGLRIEDVSGSPTMPIPTTTEIRTVRVGENLFVNLLLARPVKGTFPRGKLLAYELDLAGSAQLDTNRLSYDVRGRNVNPTYFLQGEGDPIRIMQGSCRKPYGMGPDALAAADRLIARNPRNLAVSVSEEHNADKGRPAVLFLTGDQIYADDVEEAHFAMLRQLAIRIIGSDESLPTSPATFQKLAKLTYGKTRRNFTLNQVRFTTEDGQGQLLGLGEYAAMYLMVWCQDVWDPVAVDKLPAEPWSYKTPVGQDHDRRKKGSCVRDMHRTLPSVRRALANVPTYMIFDDHDVTDDWNLHAEWYKNVSTSVPGRRVVANALAAYWLFQGWGNNPDHFEKPLPGEKSATLVSTIKDYCKHLRERQGGDVLPATPECQNFVDRLWDYHEWSFAAPTSPPAIFADMRTERELYPEGTGPLLMKPLAQRKLAKIAQEAGHRPDTPLIIISSAPVFNISAIEKVQTLALKVNWLMGPPQLPAAQAGRPVHDLKRLVDIDFEQWSNNPLGKAGFLRFVVERIQPSYCVFLSGEVHFGVSAGVNYYLRTPLPDLLRNPAKKVAHPPDRYGRFVQLTSSPLKNEEEKAGWFLVRRGSKRGALLNMIPLIQGGLNLIPSLRVDETSWRIIGSPQGPVEATRYILPMLSQILWIEQGRTVDPSMGEADAPIQGRCNLGVVTIEPKSDRVVHDYCLIWKQNPTGPPEIIECQTKISSLRVPVFDPASL